MDMYDCSRLLLLPFCFALNNCIYGPRHIKEIYQLYYLEDVKVREFRREFFSFNGKGIEERMEEQHK
jgi:hypothetical protein